MIGHFFGLKGTIVNGHFVDLAFEVGEVVIAPGDKELLGAGRISDIDVADRLGLGISIQIDRDAAAVAGDDQVIPGAKRNTAVAGEDFVALVAVEENEL